MVYFINVRGAGSVREPVGEAHVVIRAYLHHLAPQNIQLYACHWTILRRILAMAQ